MGHNSKGQLGDGTTSSRSTPVKVVDKNVSYASAGYNLSAFIKNDGSLWAMGQNNNGQLGDGTSSNRSTPVKIVDENVTQVATWAHTMFIKNDGSLWGMGII